MPGSLLIGIDVGTTGTKAILADSDGHILAQASQEYPTHFPHPNWAEQDPDDWWRATGHVLRRVFAESGAEPAAVAALGVSCQAPTLVAVDRGGRPVHPALIWMDRRSEAQCARLRAANYLELAGRINGGRIDPYYLLPKLLWFRDHAPEAYAACHQVLQANGYIVHRLCGAYAMDVTHGPVTLLYDAVARDWSPELIAAAGVDPDKLPPIAECTKIMGTVTRDAAEFTGLAAGTPVIASMADGPAAALEVGLVSPGDGAEMTGQSTVLLVCSDRPYLGQELIPVGHPVPGLHFVVGAMVATGGALRWVRDQLGEVERQEAARRGVDPFELLTQEAQDSPPGANRLIFLPYMYGERSPIWDTYARGVFFGLTLATQKRDLIRAVMEGAAYGLRHNVEQAAAAGFPIARLVCVGGGARSQLWNQIKADVLSQPIYLPRVAAGAPMGDAIAAAVGAGIYPSFAEAVRSMVRSGPSFAPRLELAERYTALYNVYLGLYPALRSSFRQLAEAPCD